MFFNNIRSITNKLTSGTLLSYLIALFFIFMFVYVSFSLSVWVDLSFTLIFFYLGSLSFYYLYLNMEPIIIDYVNNEPSQVLLRSLLLIFLCNIIIYACLSI